MTERAVTEIVGFVLVSSLVLTSVGIVYASGFDDLRTVRQDEQLSNAERAYDILASNLEDVRRGAAPGRTTELRLPDAELALVDRSSVNVTITSGAPGTPTYKRDIEPVVYRPNWSGTRLVYTNGAVMRVDGDDGVVKREPPLLLETSNGSRVTSIPIIQTRATSAERIVGGTVRLEATRASTVLLNGDNVSAETTYGVNLSIRSTPARAVVWERTIERRLASAYGTTDACSRPTPTLVACRFETDRLYVTATYVDVELTE